MEDHKAICDEMRIFMADMREWRSGAEAMITANRCTDAALQAALIELGENRIFRNDAIKRLDGIRVFLTHMAGAAAAVGGLYGVWVGASALLGAGQ